jgi:hypothetical protein
MAIQKRDRGETAPAGNRRPRAVAEKITRHKEHKEHKERNKGLVREDEG